jgi:peptidoglycan/xylan/chitin deacetylase (PgdA/CDA1 family)
VNPAGADKVLALTFDLCERANEVTGYDYEIVNYLRGNGIKATFFASGKWMLDHPEKIMQLMADPLFEVGNHAWTHDDLRVEKGIRMEDQVLWTQAQYELFWEELRARPCAEKLGAEMEKIPRSPRVFRFPYGVCSQEALDFLARNGLPAIQWSIVTGDPSKTVTSRRIAAEVIRQVKPGAIIICHANGFGYGTAGALPEIYHKLQAMGYRFVTVSELLAQGPAFAASDCYELRPGDNYRYDKIFGRQK